MSLTAASAWLAAREIGFATPVGILLTILLSLAILIAVRFLAVPETRRAKRIELMSGVWTLFMYLSIGTIPLLHRLLFA